MQNHVEPKSNTNFAQILHGSITWFQTSSSTNVFDPILFCLPAKRIVVGKVVVCLHTESHKMDVETKPMVMQ